MAVGVGTNVSLRFIEESTRGTTPGSGTSYPLRATTRNINLKKDLLESQEVSATRQRVDVRHGFNRVEGEIGFELSIKSYDDLLSYCLGQNGASGWTAPSNVTTVTIQNVSTAASTFELFKSGGTFLDGGFRPGDWITTSGAADADNNGTFQVVGASQTILTCRNANANLMTTGQSVTVAYVGKKLKIGTTLKTVTVERLFSDVPLVQFFRGCTINTMSLTIRPDAMVGGTFGFIGMSALLNGGSATVIGTSPYTVSSGFSNSPLSAFDGSLVLGGSYGFFTGTINVESAGAAVGATSVPLAVGAGEAVVLKKGDVIRFSNQAGSLYQVQADVSQTTTGTATVTISPGLSVAVTSSQTATVDYTTSTTTVTALDFTVDNQRSLLGVVGSKFSQDIYDGVAKVTGTLTTLLENQTQLSFFENELTPVLLTVRLNELGTSDYFVVTFFKVKVTSQDIDPPQNGPVLQTAGFEALEQSFAGTSTIREVMQIQRSYA